MGDISCRKCGVVGPDDGSPCANCHAAPVSYEEIHAWSRHYDTLQWTATGILLASAAALAFKVLVPDKEQAGVKTICWLGLLLTALSFYALMSFRSLRRQVHQNLPEDQIRLVRNRSRLPQWLVNYGIHVGGLGFWLGQLVKSYELNDCGGQIALILYWFGAVVSLVILWGHHVTDTARMKRP